MQISVENTSNLGRKLSIVVPAEKVEEKISQKIKEISNQVKLDGFRPGKVPASVVKQRFGANARQEVVGEMLQSTLYEAIMEKNLKPAGLPEIDSIKSEDGQPLEYTAIFEVYPEIELVDFTTLDVEKNTAEVTDADVEDTLKNIQKQNAEWKDVERAAQLGDKVLVDFEGFHKDGEAFEGGKAEDSEITLGSGSFIPGFEDGIIGKKVNDEFDINVTFPEEYHAKDLAGKEVVFKIKLKKVQEAILPEMDAEFVKKMNIESGDVEEFKKQVRSHMERELEHNLESLQKERLFTALLDKHEFETPNALITNEVKAMFKQFMPNQEPTQEQVDSAPEEFKKEAEKRVKIGLIVAEIIRKNDIKVDHDKVKENIEKMAESYDEPQKMIAWYYGDKQRMASIEALTLEKQVFDFVCEQAKITEKALNYSDVMKAK